MRSLLLLAALCGACFDDDGTVVELGIIEFLDENTSMIDAPTTASVGQPLIVRVTTYSDLCTHYERTDVEVSAAGADVWPYNRGPEHCKPQKLCYIPHEAQLQFDTPGVKTLRVHGRRRTGTDGEIEVLREIVVE